MVDRAHSIKIGSLWKRTNVGGGKSFFTRRNYRPRVFILTHQTLCFYSGNVNNVGSSKGRIDVPCIRAVEFVDDNAFGLPHTFQVTHIGKKNGFQTAYITATDKTECAEWVSKLRKESQPNMDMLMHYHSGAHIKSKWTCCSSRDKTALGCQPTYFLLTKSSSRYADLRRKDTLTHKPSLKNHPMHLSTENVHCIEERPMSSCAGLGDMTPVRPPAHVLLTSNSDLDMVHSIALQNTTSILSREELLRGRSSPVGSRSYRVDSPLRSSYAPSCTSVHIEDHSDGPVDTTPLQSSASSCSTTSFPNPPPVHKVSVASLGEPITTHDIPPPIPPRSAIRMKCSPPSSPQLSYGKPLVPPRKESNKTAPVTKLHHPPPIRQPLMPTVSLPFIHHPASRSCDPLPGLSADDSPQHVSLTPMQSSPSPIALRKRKPTIAPRLVYNNPNMIQL